MIHRKRNRWEIQLIYTYLYIYIFFYGDDWTETSAIDIEIIILTWIITNQDESSDLDDYDFGLFLDSKRGKELIDFLLWRQNYEIKKIFKKITIHMFLISKIIDGGLNHPLINLPESFHRLDLKLYANRIYFFSILQYFYKNKKMEIFLLIWQGLVKKIKNFLVPRWK